MIKIKKKLLIGGILLFALLIITGCNKNTQNNADTLKEIFVKEVSTGNKDIESIANKISKSSIIETNVEVFEIMDGDYLQGFTSEIKGYTKAYGIRPMIGSIPFIAYVFETDNPVKLKSDLEEKADLRWNICTEADYMKTEIKDKYVFFTMIPKEF